MIDKLSASQERRIMRGIEKAIAYTRSGSSPDEALVKMATELEFTPEITKRACEAFNKSKTVHVLTSRKSGDRAESFEHADPSNVVNTIFGGTEKTASLNLPATDFSAIDFIAPMQKAASAPEQAPEKDRKTFVKEASAIEYRRDMAQRMEVLDNFDRQKSRMNQSKLLAQDSLMKAAENMRYLKQKDLNKIAHVIVNRFGTPGAKMLNVVGAKIQRELPIEKTANGAVLPLSSPYPELDQAVRYAREYTEHKEALQKLAEDSGSFFFEKTSAPSDTKEILDAGKGAAGFMGTTAVPFALGAAGQGAKKGIGALADEVGKWSSIVNPDPKPQLLNMMDPEFVGGIQNIDNMQGWVEVASDPAIKNYPIEDVTEAYNNIINVAPSTRQPSMQPALKSLVKRQLAQKQLMDPAEINQLVDLESSRTQTDKARADLEQSQLREATQPDVPYGLEDILRSGKEESADKPGLGAKLKEMAMHFDKQQTPAAQ